MLGIITGIMAGVRAVHSLLVLIVDKIYIRMSSKQAGLPADRGERQRLLAATSFKNINL